MSILFSEADKKLLNEDKSIDINKLTKQQQEVLEYSKMEPDKQLTELSKPLKASYKIQIVFDNKRSQRNLTSCLLTCWRSTGHLNEHNDQILYLCRSQKDANIGCGFPFLEDAKHCLINGQPSRLFICQNCPKVNNEYKLINPNKVVTFVYFRLPYKTLAEVVYEYFRKLNGDADIYVKHFKFNYTDNLIGDKEFAIYPLERIIKDSTEGGNQIIKNIEAFLSA